MKNNLQSIEQNKFAIFVGGYFALLILLLLPRKIHDQIISEDRILKKFSKEQVSQFYVQGKIVILGLIVIFTIIFNLFVGVGYAFLMAFNFLSLVCACSLPFVKDEDDGE